jgi:hypothetical protein
MLCSAQSDWTGAKLLEACNATIRSIDQHRPGNPVEDLRDGICIGYFHGFMDGQSAAVSGLVPSKSYCPPASLTVEQSMRITLKFINDHPEHLHRYGGDIAAVALLKAFPCQRGQQ